MDCQIINNDVRVRSHIVETYRGHEHEVCALKWSYSGQQLASGVNDNLLHIWNRSMASSNAPTQWLHRLEEHTSAVKALAWCPFQSNLLASGGGGGDCTIKLWNAHTELTGHTSRVLFMAQSPDGCTVASAAVNETLRFWNVFGVPKSAKPAPKAYPKPFTNVYTIDHVLCSRTASSKKEFSAKCNHFSFFTIFKSLEFLIRELSLVTFKEVHGNSANEQVIEVRILAFRNKPLTAIELLSREFSSISHDKPTKPKPSIPQFLFGLKRAGNSWTSLSEVQLWDSAFIWQLRTMKNQLAIWNYPLMVKMAELTGLTSRVFLYGSAADEILRFWNVFGVPQVSAKPAPKARP
ncbi:hypothetical protein FNV43_RR19101 [Rhamnella rubrinervis]|uniref:Uncharacterized protein n=1 Tax=Rhamnella rubrinervis TaxID=2594499 RepID=A0A8K0GY68_9ROSA|nr:hypothetical protein FNV43_RR19101 [Rhamnella rubrinervis]